VPFCNIYSTFMQRGYDQVVHDVCLQNLHVVFCLDRAGFAGADGPTHHGAYDIAYMRCIPNMVVAAPMNEQELRNMMYTASQEGAGPFTIRYPRGEGVMPNWRTPLELQQVGTGRTIQEGEELAILTFGHIGNYAVEVCQKLSYDGINPGHYDMRYCKPLDEELLHHIFQKYSKVITVEDGCLQGGFGSAVLEFMVDNGYTCQVKRLGMPDAIFEHGSQLELHRDAGFDPTAIENTVREMVSVPVKIA
jgi:1-deoxy-D-xylulose-5-phosphate synthase